MANTEGRYGRYGLQQIEVASIRVDHDLQPRAAINQEVVEEYAAALEDGATFPPVTVFDDGQVYWLADGFHRHAAALRAKQTTIACNVAAGNRRAAMVAAACANTTHGLRRTNADKRRAVTVLLQDPEWVDKTDRKIASVLGVDHRFVGHMREELGAGRDVRLVERNGTTFERRNPAQPTPPPEPAQGPHPLRNPQTIAEFGKLPLGVLHRAGVALTAAGAPCLEAGEQLVAQGLTGALVLSRGLPGSPYDWVIIAEHEPRGDRHIEHVGSTMRKAAVNKLLHQLAAGQCQLKHGAELRRVTPPPAPSAPTLADTHLSHGWAGGPLKPAKVHLTGTEVPPVAPVQAEPARKSKIPAPKPAAPAEPVDQEPEVPDALRRTWTVLASLFETVDGHLARAEAGWKAGVKEILGIAKAGAKPVRSSDLAGMRKGATHDGDRFLYQLQLVRKLASDFRPYQACGCPPERRGGGSADAADHCLDCGGRGWLNRHEAQYVSDRRAKAGEG